MTNQSDNALDLAQHMGRTEGSPAPEVRVNPTIQRRSRSTSRRTSCVLCAHAKYRMDCRVVNPYQTCSTLPRLPCSPGTVRASRRRSNKNAVKVTISAWAACVSPQPRCTRLSIMAPSEPAIVELQEKSAKPKSHVAKHDDQLANSAANSAISSRSTTSKHGPRIQFQ